MFAFIWAVLTHPAALALAPQDKLTQYGRQTWQTENGLPQNTVRAIVQDHEGFVWLGTEGGLVRFDGLQFIVFDAENTRTLKSNSITSLLEDKAGTLWIGTTEGVTSRHSAEFQSYTTEDGLPGNHILSLVSNATDGISAVTPEGTAHFDNNHFIRDTAATRKPLEIAFTVQDRYGHMWTGTEHGLTVLQGKTAKTYTTKDGLPSNRVTYLYADREGSVWAGTDAGAVRIFGGNVETFPAGDPFSRDTVLSIYEDREGNVWLGSDTSVVTILRNQSFTTYISRDGALENQVRCVLQTRDGSVWIGTNGGGLRRYKNGQFTTLATTDGLASNIILSLAEDTTGTLLIGTPDGLNRLRNGKVSTMTSSDGLAEDFVRSVYADTEGSIWAGTRRGLSQILDKRVITYTQANGLGSDLIGAIVPGRDHDLWIGTLHGLTHFDKGVFKNYTTKDGLSSSVITDLYMDSEGTIWIGTQGGGLNCLRQGTFTSFTTQNGLPETIYGIHEDTNGNLWLAAQNGIFRVNKSSFSRPTADRVAVISYGTSDGLQVSECLGGGHPAIWKSQDGALWFSTAKGAAELRPGSNRVHQLPPPVALESVLVDDRRFDPAQITEVAPGHSRLSFEYAGLSFLAPQKVQFRYRLEGFDRDWIYAGTRRTAYYTNLPPGHYRFHAAASNNDGLWNRQGISFPIRILPRYYQTWWFSVLLLAIAALLVYAVYYWRVRQVQAQFNAVLQERNRIAREIHDTLAQGFVGVSVQLEIVSRLLNSSTEAAKEHLDQARAQVRHSLADARRSIWELRSQSREHQDFAARLWNAAKQVAASSPAKVQLQVHGTYRPLTTEVEDEVFRITQEAVTNAVRHSGAHHINIDLTFDVKKLRVVVGDDGCGFDSTGDISSGPNGHFGLKGMRERAQQIHGELIVNSEIGKGTKVCVEVPAK